MKKHKRILSLIMAVMMVAACFAIPSVAQAKDCSYCSGKGTRWCYNCNGSGTVHSFNAYKNDYVFKSCPKCGGDGQVTCVYCNGTGSDSSGVGSAMKPTITSIYAAKKGFVVEWSYPHHCSGYQVQYSRNKKFKNAGKVKIKGESKSSKTVKKLKSKKVYYVRVRSYTTKNGKTAYSKWSPSKKVKTK